jgi:hypothetical protein
MGQAGAGDSIESEADDWHGTPRGRADLFTGMYFSAEHIVETVMDAHSRRALEHAVRTRYVVSAFPVTAIFMIWLAIAPDTALAQPHSVNEGPYVLRASTVNSESLPEETARAHGIARDPRRGVLNVMVAEKKGKDSWTTHARVHAAARDLTGQSRDIPMREIDSNGSVTYLGTYEFVRGEVMDFIVDAVPLGSDRELRLTFRDRLWPEK